MAARVIDLSYAAAYRLGFIDAGSAEVELESVQPAREQAGAVYVQVGAFTTRDNAESLQARVTRELAWLQETAQVLLSGTSGACRWVLIARAKTHARWPIASRASSISSRSSWCASRRFLPQAS